MRAIAPALLAAAAVALATAPLAAQSVPSAKAAPASTAADSLPMPKVGDLAPDFTIRGATRDGVLQSPITLSSLRGSTVVLAFFPAARTQGCTVQMKAYRDQYASLFNDGKKVVVLAVSVDADTTLANWAQAEGFPMTMGSDPDQAVGRAYGSVRGRYDARNLFVIGPDGRITYRVTPFNVLSQDAYAQLGAAVRATLGTAGSSTGGSTR